MARTRLKLDIVCVALLGLTLVSSSMADSERESESDSLERRAARIRPTEDESRWTQIPWVRSVIDGQRQARQERRPIMYWHVDDDPLERC